jgi:hypothetical protein
LTTSYFSEGNIEKVVVAIEEAEQLFPADDHQNELKFFNFVR